MIAFIAPWRRVRLLLAAWVLSLTPMLATAGAMVWATDGTQLHQVDASTKALVRTLAYGGIVPKSLSADGSGGVWFADSTSIRHLDGGGVQQSQTLLSALGLTAPVVIAADPTDGTAWVGSGGAVVQVRADGSKGVPITLAGQTLVALRVGLNHKPWLLTNALLFQATVDGSAFPFTDVVQVAGTTPKALAVDVQGTAAWVALNGTTAGAASYVLKLDHGTTPFTRLQLGSGPASFVAANAVSGDLWAYSPAAGTAAPSLQRFSRAGALLSTVAQPTGGDGMDVDAASGVVWEGQATGLRAIAADGSVLATLATGTAIRGVSVTAWRPAPSGGATPPGLSAPLVDKTVPSLLGTTTAFLYTGSNPVQTGVAAGTIDAKRAAVVRGKVLTRDGTPLPGVTVQVLNHPEFGKTVTRADGLFDMAVNGGGPLTLQYTGTGYLPVQRQVSPRWQEFAVVDDVVLLQLDSQVTRVSLGAAAMQSARGSLTTDADGTRRSTVLFPANTSATMTLADGSVRALSVLNVRATEYTVGPSGPKAMPGPLPPTSGYTYAVELSADEAMAADATMVTFSQPVIHYVENFLKFPVGGVVPVGYYDRAKSAWIAAPNGRVIKVLSVSGGLAVLDTDGDGVGDDAAKLAALKVTQEELKQLGSMYGAGATLWRVPVDHFTPWDHNWPYAPPPDAKPPRLTFPQKPVEPCSDACERKGSIIEAQNQDLGERIAVAGTSVVLNYRSTRAPARNNRTLIIPLSGVSVPSSLRGIELAIDVAGQHFAQIFPPSAGQSFTFEWDGKDAFGRALVGDQTAVVTVSYIYPLVYTAPADLDAAFAAFGGDTLGLSRQSGEFTMTQILTTSLTTLNQRGATVASAGLGDWTLDVQHTYDLTSRTLVMGDGRSRRAADISKIINAVGGGGLQAPTDGMAVSSARFVQVSSLLATPDGSYYVADSGRVWRVGVDGRLSRVAGSPAGLTGFSGDGGPARDALLQSFIAGLALAPDGSLYIADMPNHRVRRVSPNGTITTVAGNGQVGLTGDGGPATQASFTGPNGVAIGVDGSLYVSDFANGRVRRVSADGIVSTYAGTVPFKASTGDGGPALLATIQPDALAMSPEGSLYLNDFENCTIRRVSPDGMISKVAGQLCSAFSGDGGPATDAALRGADSMAFRPDGTLYFADRGNGRVRQIDSSGTIMTIAGTGSLRNSGDGGPAAAAGLDSPAALTITPEGSILVSTEIRSLRKISPALPGGFTDAQITIASDDGAQLYQFDATGRHLKTVDARTGAPLFSFSYTTAGFLDSITDAGNNSLKIRREAAGAPTAIVSADGQVTQLSLDAAGRLAQVIDPLGQTYAMTYSADGLLLSLRNPRGQASTMQYDAYGLLVSDLNPAAGSWTLARERNGITGTVTMTSGEGRATSYQIEPLTTGDQRRTNTWPDQTKTVSLRGQNGITTTTRPDGSVLTTAQGPDPRFGMQAPFTTSSVLMLPSGLTRSMTTSRSATLANPADLMSLTQETETMLLNGRSFVSTYDAASRSTTTTSAQGRKSVVTVDSVGRPLTVTLGGLAPVSYAYDVRGRLIQMTHGSGTTARSLTYAYGTDGYVQSITDAMTNAVVYQRDAVGRPTQTTLPGSRVLAASFDANGNTTTLTPPGKPAHAFSYTPVDLEAQYTPPALAGIADPASRFTYNRDKDLTSVSLPDGSGLVLAYEAGSGRLLSVTPSAGAGNAVSFGYAAATGQLNSVNNVDASWGITYDGPLARQETLTGSVPGTISRVFDTDFRVTQQTVNGVATTYAYDGDSLLTQAGALTLVRDAATGLLNATSLGTVATTQAYDTFGELQAFGATFNGGSLYSYSLSYDRAGRISGKTETIGGVTTQLAYGYDTAGRLATVSRNGTQIASYGYDANGNRTTINGSVVASYDAQDRLLTHSTASYQFTANGALKSRTQGTQTTSYRYDAFGNLKAVDLPSGMHIDYLADGANRRIGKKLNGVLVQGFVYESQLRIAAELNGAGAVVSSFVYGDKVNVPEYMVKGGATFRIVTDQLGSVRLVVNSATGAIAQRIDYDEWGNVTSDTSPGFQPFGFAGGLYDRDTKLVRFGVRDYDAAVGRWTAKDPILFRGDSRNLYAYVQGQPIRLVDPSGRGARGAAIGGAIGAAGGAFLGGIGGAVLGGGAGTLAAPGAGTIAGGIGGADVGAVAGGSLGLAIGAYLGDKIGDFLTNASSLPKGFWPGDKGAEEWGRRNGCGAKEGRRRFHQGVKQNDGFSRPRDVYGVNPETGEVVDPEGEIVGDLNAE